MTDPSRFFIVLRQNLVRWRFTGGDLLPTTVALHREGDTCRLTATDPLPPLGILILKLK